MIATNPHSVPQIPLDRVTQALYAKIFAAMESVRRSLTEAHTATQAWVAVFAEFRDSLPELDLPAYHELRSQLGCVAQAFARGANAPLRPETYRLALQVVEHDLPRVAAIAAKLNEEDAPKFFSAVSKDRPEMTLAYFETPEIKPKTRIRRADFDRAISTILRTRMEELDRLIREDTAAWLREQGITGDAFEIEEAGPVEYLFKPTGATCRVIFAGCPEFSIKNTLGAQYVNWLLHHPNKHIDALALEREIAPDKAEARDQTSIQTNIDADAQRAYVKEVGQLRLLAEKLRKDNRTVELEQTETEIAAIEAELREGGRTADSGERARNNVRKALDVVKRGLRKGDKHAKAFGMHIETLVETGFVCVYKQPRGEIWA